MSEGTVKKTIQQEFVASTRVGTINRQIENGIAVAVSGGRGGMSQALKFAKEREKLLAPRPFKLREHA
jgi:hypothetical protein